MQWANYHSVFAASSSVQDTKSAWDAAARPPPVRKCASYPGVAESSGLRVRGRQISAVRCRIWRARVLLLLLLLLHLVLLRWLLLWESQGVRARMRMAGRMLTGLSV